MSRRGALTGALIGLCGFAASDASAATLSFEPTDYGLSRLAYVAAHGEANSLVVRWADDGGTVAVQDEGAVIESPDECTPDGAHSVSCPTAGVSTRVIARLGDGDDTATMNRFDLRAYGGAGRDLLDAGGARGELDGGAGPDTLLGGAAPDVFSGGAGADSIDGRGGDDHVSYSDRKRPVVVDLSRPSTDGAAAEGDSIANVESAEGGDGDDTLIAGRTGRLFGNGGDDVLRGGAHRNWLEGNRGDDRMVGGGGPDKIVGGYGRDAIDAGPGEDDIRIRDFRTKLGRDQRDRVRCGSGDDYIESGPNYYRAAWPTSDVLQLDCERISPPAWTFVSVRRLPTSNPARVFRLLFPCATPGGGRCRVRVVLRTGGRVVGTGRKTIRDDEQHRFRISLDEYARTRLAEAGEILLRIDVTVAYGRAGNESTGWWMVLPSSG